MHERETSGDDDKTTPTNSEALPYEGEALKIATRLEELFPGIDLTSVVLPNISQELLALINGSINQPIRIPEQFITTFITPAINPNNLDSIQLGKGNSTTVHTDREFTPKVVQLAVKYSIGHGKYDKHGLITAIVLFPTYPTKANRPSLFTVL